LLLAIPSHRIMVLSVVFRVAVYAFADHMPR